MLVNQQGGGIAGFPHPPLAVDIGRGAVAAHASPPFCYQRISSPPMQPSTPPLKQGEDPLWQRRAPGRLQLQSLRLDHLPSGGASHDPPSTHPPPLGSLVMPGVGMHVVNSQENLAALQWQQQQQQQQQQQHMQQHQYQHMYLQIPTPQQMGSPMLNPMWTEFVGTVLSNGIGSDDSRKRRGSFSFDGTAETKRMFISS